MRKWLSMLLLCLGLSQTGCGGDASYYAVATGADTHGVSIASFKVMDMFGSQLLLCSRFDLFLDGEAENAEIRISGAGGTSAGAGLGAGGTSSGATGSTGSATGGIGGTGSGTGATGTGTGGTGSGTGATGSGASGTGSGTAGAGSGATGTGAAGSGTGSSSGA